MSQAHPQQVREWIEQSIRRSPGQDEPLSDDQVASLLAAIGEDINQGHARLWVGPTSAVVTQPVLGERVWHAGGEMGDIISQMQRAAKILKAQGVERLTIEATRKGWAKALRPYGFVTLQGLEVEL